MVRSSWGKARGILGVVSICSVGLALAILSCSAAPQAFLVQGGGGVTGDDPPTLTKKQAESVDERLKTNHWTTTAERGHENDDVTGRRTSR